MKKCHFCKKSYKDNLITNHTHGELICRPCNTERYRNYRQTPSGKKATLEASKRAYIKHKHKWIARAKVQYAVKKGFLIKPKWCEVCNLVKPLQGHHEDYSKPLEVIWLCTGCHADADKILEASPIEPK